MAPRLTILAAALAIGFAAVASAQEAPPPAAIDPSSVAPALTDPPPNPWAAQIEAARVRHDDWLACIQAKRFKCDDKAKPDPMDALLNDDTLVVGDVVSTPQGLKVFRGQPGTPHRREDFQ